jgi:hypothetical protein
MILSYFSTSKEKCACILIQPICVCVCVFVYVSYQLAWWLSKWNILSHNYELSLPVNSFIVLTSLSPDMSDGVALESDTSYFSDKIRMWMNFVICMLLWHIVSWIIMSRIKVHLFSMHFLNYMIEAVKSSIKSALIDS